MLNLKSGHCESDKPKKYFHFVKAESLFSGVFCLFFYFFVVRLFDNMRVLSFYFKALDDLDKNIVFIACPGATSPLIPLRRGKEGIGIKLRRFSVNFPCLLRRGQRREAFSERRRGG